MIGESHYTAKQMQEANASHKARVRIVTAQALGDAMTLGELHEICSSLMIDDRLAPASKITVQTACDGGIESIEVVAP